MTREKVQQADLTRFREITARMDERAGRILTYHAALEAELERLLAVLLPRGELLAKLNYSNKTLVLRGAWHGHPDKADSLCDFLQLFGELRNSIAHQDKRHIVNAWIAKLQAHYAKMPGSDGSHENASIDDMASDIAGTFAGLTYNLLQRRPPYPPPQAQEPPTTRASEVSLPSDDSHEPTTRRGQIP